MSMASLPTDVWSHSHRLGTDTLPGSLLDSQLGGRNDGALARPARRGGARAVADARLLAPRAAGRGADVEAGEWTDLRGRWVLGGKRGSFETPFELPGYKVCAHGASQLKVTLSEAQATRCPKTTSTGWVRRGAERTASSSVLKLPPVPPAPTLLVAAGR